MLKDMRIILTLLCFALSAPAMAADKIAVMEMFSAQGCIDTPPAEAAFNDLMDEFGENIIAFNCHVTFFDKRGWPDPFSNPICDERYKAYDAANMYTGGGIPQLILNGEFGASRVRRPITKAMAKMGVAEGNIQPAQLTLNGDVLEVSIEAQALTKPVDLWLISVDHNNTTEVTAGVNEGGLFYQSNLVRHFSKIGEWDGNAYAASHSVEDIEGDGYIVIAQNMYDYKNLFDEQILKIVAAGQVFKTPRPEPDLQ